MIQRVRVLLKKECTGTGHQPSEVGTFAAYLSNRVSKGKGLPMNAADAAALRFRRQTEQTHSAEGYLAKSQLGSDRGFRF